MVIYHPPGQILATFLEELDRLLSSFVEDGTLLLVFGNFNIHLDKPYATDFHSLLVSFDLKHLTNTSTHKSGNQLDLIYTRDCTADNILVHISDHFFIKLTLHFATRVLPTPLPITFRRNLSPSHLSSVVSSSLPSPNHFSSLDVNAATDTLCSTLTSCLDYIFPLSSRPARTAPSNPWLSDVLRGYQTRLRAADKKLCKSNDPLDLRRYQLLLFKLINYYYYYYYYYLSLLKSTRPNRHISITRSTVLQTCVISSEHFIISSVFLHHLPPLL